MTTNCTNCGTLLMNEATVCPVCQQPVPPAPRNAGWPQPNQPANAPWQAPAGQPSFGPPPLAGGSNPNVAWVAVIVMVVVLMVGGIFGALVYFKSNRSMTTRNYNYNRYPRATPTPYVYEPEPPPPPLNSNGGSAPRAPISGGILNGKATSLPKPVYPPIAKSARASGTVVVQVTVDETGEVISARAVSGHPLLQAAAVQAAYQATFSPTRLNGQPVKITGTINYIFVQE